MRAISKKAFKNLKIGDKIKLHCGHVGFIKELNFNDPIYPVFVRISAKDSSTTEYSAKFNSGWKEELMIVKIL
jgi:hypothetical protein